MVAINLLPHDVLVEIMVRLDHISLLRCSSTCKLLYSIYHGSLALQYIAELGIDGLEDAGSLVSLTERLSRLRDLCAAWQNLHWKGYKEVGIGAYDISYEFVAGVFAIEDADSKFKVKWLPSSIDEEHALEYQTLGIPVAKFTIDPTQNLLIILEEASTSQVQPANQTQEGHQLHPLARQPILTFSISPSDHNDRVGVRGTLHVVYDIVALFDHGRGRVLIWNWNHGTLLCDFEPSHPAAIQDFLLLDKKSFILASRLDSGALLLYTFSTTATPTAPPIFVGSLHLPPINPAHKVHSLDIDSGACYAKPTKGALFFSSFEEHILVFSIMYSDCDTGELSDRPSYELYVHNSTLRKYTKRHSSDVGEIVVGPPLEVQWKDWGEAYTTFEECTETKCWMRFLHGNRVVCIKPDDYLDCIDVLDFNFARISISKATFGNERRLFCDPSVISSTIFTSPVVARLPYSISTVEFEKPYYAYMIDEQRLIAVETDPDDPYFIKGLDVYWF